MNQNGFKFNNENIAHFRGKSEKRLGYSFGARINLSDSIKVAAFRGKIAIRVEKYGSKIYFSDGGRGSNIEISGELDKYILGLTHSCPKRFLM